MFCDSLQAPVTLPREDVGVGMSKRQEAIRKWPKRVRQVAADLGAFHAALVLRIKGEMEDLVINIRRESRTMQGKS